MDGVSGLEAGEKAIFWEVTVQRCMVHLVRNWIDVNKVDKKREYF